MPASATNWNCHAHMGSLAGNDPPAGPHLTQRAGASSHPPSAKSLWQYQSHWGFRNGVPATNKEVTWTELNMFRSSGVDDGGGVVLAPRSAAASPRRDEPLHGCFFASSSFARAIADIALGPPASNARW